MKAAEIKEILAGTFTDESDRLYWVEKLAEVERKETSAKETEEYLRAMRKYDRNDVDAHEIMSEMWYL